MKLDRDALPDHAPYSPSAMGRIIPCPLSVSLSKKAPKELESPYALEGTHAHTYAANELLGKDVEYDFEVTSDMIDAVDIYYEHCDPLLEKATKYGIEIKVVADEELFGSVDMFAIVENHLHLTDFKYGAGVIVPAERNKQLMTYAALLFLDDEVDMPTIEGVTMHIVQPRGMGDAITSWSCKVSDIDEHLTLVDSAINSSKLNNPPGKMGDWCRFCPAKIICPVLAAAEQGVVNWDVNDIDLGDLGQLLLQAQVLEAKAKAMFSYAHARMEDGNHIPGWKLVPKRAMRKWTDTEAVFRWIKKRGKKKQMTTINLISPAQADKILGDEYESITHLVESKSSGTNIKPSDDSAEEVQSLGNALKAIGSLPKL